MSRQQCKEKVGHAIRDAVNSFEARQKKKEKAIRDGFPYATGAPSSSMLLHSSGLHHRRQRFAEMHHVGQPSHLHPMVPPPSQHIDPYHRHPPPPSTDYSQRKRRRRNSSRPDSIMTSSSPASASDMPLKPSPIQPPSGLVTRMPPIQRSPIQREHYHRPSSSSSSLAIPPPHKVFSFGDDEDDDNHHESVTLPPPVVPTLTGSTGVTSTSLAAASVKQDTHHDLDDSNHKVRHGCSTDADYNNSSSSYHPAQPRRSTAPRQQQHNDDNFDLAIDAVLGPMHPEESLPHPSASP